MTPATRAVVVLEDSPGRIDAMRRAIAHHPALELCAFERAPEFLAWLAAAQGGVALISLDYHLGALSKHTGLDAARALAAREPLAPVVLHSSDPAGARAQEQVLQQGGWLTERRPFREASWTQALPRLTARPSSG